MMSDSYGAPQADGLLPSVEPVPVSPLRAAIPSAFWDIQPQRPDCIHCGAEPSLRAIVRLYYRRYFDADKADDNTAEYIELFASAIETGTAKTEGLGPQDESAAPKADAQPQEPTP